jgi:PAS domain S-box-containing protein
MSGPTSFELCTVIKSDETLCDIPVIFLTPVNCNKKCRIQALECGCDAFLPEPIDEPELIAQIKAMVKIKHGNRNNRNEKERLSLLIDDQTRELKIKNTATLNLLEDLKQENEARRNSELEYRNLFENMVEGYAYCRMIYENGIAIDWIYISVNEAFEKLTGLKDVTGKRVSEVIPGIRETDPNIFETYSRVALTYQNERFEMYLEALQIWFSISVYSPKNEYFVAVFDVITERKAAEKALRESESRFFTIFHSMPIPISISDLTTDKYVEINQAFINVSGYSQSEIIGHSFRDLNLWKRIEDREKMRKLLSEQGNVSNFEVDIVKKSGESGTMLISVEKVELTGIPYLLIMATEITERKRAQEELLFRNILLSTQLEASIDGILVVDEKSHILSYNHRFVEMWNIPPELIEEGDDEPILEYNTSQITNAESFSDKIQHLYTNRKETSHDEITLKDGRVFDRYSAPMIGSEEQYLGRIWYFRDITERVKTEAMLIHTDRMANLGEMAAGIAHEINQPLNIISLVMDNILFESTKTVCIDTEFFKTKSNKIFENITRIRNIIDHIRAFSRSHDDFVLTGFDINTGIENAVSMITDQYKNNVILLNLNLENQLPHLYGNIYKFEQVIINLLSNAKDALLEKKSKNPEMSMLVNIRSYYEKSRLIVEIVDNGIGIPRENIQNVFLPFYTTKDTGKGTGLGLSICYQIVKEMGGTMELESNQSVGTKIKICLNLHNN